MQIYKTIPFGQGIIDSLTIQIPFDKVEVIDYRLISETKAVYIHTGEIDENIQPPKAIFYDQHGIKYRIGLESMPPNKQRPYTEKYIRLTLTSKMAKQYYFQGITHQTLPTILNTINESNIIKLDIETLLNSNSFDIDVCQNFEIDFETYSQSIEQIKILILETKKHALQNVKTKKKFSNLKNVGLTFMDRNKASISLPHWIVYNKTNELKTNSLQFYETFIKPNNIDIENIIRKEVTIKNYAMKQNLKNQNLVSEENKLQTLNDTLNLSSQELTEINNSLPTTYFSKPTKERKPITQLNYLDLIIYNTISLLIENGKSKQYIKDYLNVFSSDVNGRKQKQRTFDKIDFIFEYIENDKLLFEKAKQNDKVWTFINDLKLW
jgi:hypothetical protein